MVALAVPPPWRERLARIQEELRPVGWNITIGPHITLVPPGAASVPISVARRRFELAAQRSGGFRLSYPDLGVFSRRGLATVFLKPVATDQLFELRRQLQILAASWQDTSRSLRRPFVPHVTLVNRLPENQAAECLERLSGLAPLSIKFDEPRLFTKRPSDKEWLQIS